MSVIGIDLGTTYSAAAISAEGHSARVIDNEEGFNITPSVVFFPDSDDGEEPLVGTMAKNSAASAPYNTVQFIKRMMGNPDWKYTSPNDTDFHPEEITALILRKIKSFAELDLGHEVTGAVVTVPAYFDDARRTATKQAGEIAGLNILKTLNEPTAAAIAFGLMEKKSGRVLVYDLGGGTFDITLMDINDGEFDVIATDGHPNLGGFDFDNVLKDLIVAELAEQGYTVDAHDDVLQSEIREKAENVKRTLTAAEQKTAIFTIDGKTYKVKISRSDFEEAAKSLLRQTSERLELLLEEANTQWSEIDHLLMIGGSTRMPMVKHMLEEMSGKELKYEVHPDEAVALGAGIYAAGLNGSNHDRSKLSIPGGDTLSISDVTSQSLGTIVFRGESSVKENSIIIRRNNKIPAKESKEYSTILDNQTKLEVKVTEGDDTDPNYVNILGSKTLDIPPYPKGAPIRITFAYDIDQTVFVEVFDITANKSLGSFDIDRVANFSNDEIKNLQDKMADISTVE